MDGGEGIEITYHDGVAALTLDMATAEDTGCYSCIAVNTEGKSTTSCQVVVSGLFIQNLSFLVFACSLRIKLLGFPSEISVFVAA